MKKTLSVLAVLGIVSIIGSQSANAFDWSNLNPAYWGSNCRKADCGCKPEKKKCDKCKKDPCQCDPCTGAAAPIKKQECDPCKKAAPCDPCAKKAPCNPCQKAAPQPCDACDRLQEMTK